ncbi:MAG: DoxX family membrane protein [Candidatus Eremiobacteraeota bacterium]|nr:DoxX family membrane protein [Candidatus Eremiobacteraeota bacterium]
MKMLVTVLRVALGAVFLYACASKLFHPGEFAEMVMGYRILPSEFITLAATALPWLELLVGLGLVFGVLSAGCAAWATLLSGTFLMAKISVIVRGLDVSCGCFSVHGGASITWADIPANAVLLLVAVLVWWKGPGALALDSAILEEETE